MRMILSAIDRSVSESRPGVGLALTALILLGGMVAPPPALSADMIVPSGPYPTLEIAVATAKVNGDPINTIHIDGGITVGSTIGLDGSFNSTRELIIRPAAHLARATIEVLHSSVAFHLDFCENVTIQDLDIVRTAPNLSELFNVTLVVNVVIERCRLGAIATAPGSAGACVFVAYPKEVLIRNTICFGLPHGTFDQGIHVINLSDPENSIFLYNNVVADFGAHGVWIDAAGGAPGALVLLRNNVVVNQREIPAALEPFAYRSDVQAPPVTIVTSHNVAFCSVGKEEVLGGGASTISGSGIATGQFLRFGRSEVDDVFVEWYWALPWPFDPNADFFRLQPVGNPMHDDPTDHGLATANGFPHPRDKIVDDDIEGDPRPNGAPIHTDRGVDQLEQGIPNAVDPGSPSAPALFATSGPNPARAARVEYRVERSGRLEFELFDASGRRLHEDVRPVSAGDLGRFELPGGLQSGVHFFRLRLRSGTRAWSSSGRVTVLR